MQYKVKEWKKLFQTEILSRGKRYFTNHLIQDVEYDGKYLTAEAIGSRFYEVSIWIENGFIRNMACTCPHATDGAYCKHMAGTLHAAEANYPSCFGGKEGEGRKVIAKKATKIIYPFRREKSTEKEDYRYFDMQEMCKNLQIKEDDYERAQKFLQDEIVEWDRVNFQYDNYNKQAGLQGYAHGLVHEKGGCFRKVWIHFQKGNILRGSCEATRCYCSYGDYQKKLCAHLIALLIELDKYLLSENPGDATDENGARFLENYQTVNGSTVGNDASQIEENVVLEPRLEMEDGILKTGFKIGTDKLYVVKNLQDLAAAVQNAQEYRLGVKNCIHFARQTFDEKSKELYRFIEKCIMEENQRAELQYQRRYYYRDDALSIKSTIDLFGQRLDDFFANCNGRNMEYYTKQYYKKSKSMVKLCDKEPKLKIKINKELDREGVFQGIQVETAIPEMTYGFEYGYYLDVDCFCRVSKEFKQAIEPMTSVMYSGEKKLSMHIGRRNMAAFYRKVLPCLAQYATIKENEGELIRSYLAPEAAFSFYLDAEDGNVTCRVLVKYGEEERSTLDWLKEQYHAETFRDMEAEKAAVMKVREYLPQINVEQDVFHCDGDEDSIYRVAAVGVEEFTNIGQVHTTDSFKRIMGRKAPKITVGISLSTGLLDLEVSSDDISREELADILNSYRKKKKYHRLRNGEFVNLEEESIEVLAGLLDSMNISLKEFVKGKMQLPSYRALYLDKLLEEKEVLYSKRDRHYKNLVKEFKTISDSDYEVPESLAKVMRGYQVKGYKWLRTLEQYGFGGILADDMGLGKTLQMISVLLACKAEGKKGTSIIISPASLVYNWQEEIHRFAPELTVCTITGSQKERKALLASYEAYDVVVTSYDLLKRDVEEYEGKHFYYEIIDEAQYIKTQSTAAAKAVKVLCAERRVALTGTPIENRLSELWSIFDFLMPGYLYNYEVFKRELETPIAKYQEEEASKRLKRMVAPFVLRRLKGDVLKDLPEKMEEVRYAKFEEKQQMLYDAQVAKVQELLSNTSKEEFSKEKIKILAELTRMRQICCDPNLLYENYDGESAKLQACMELIQSALEGNHKMLIFSQFTSMLEIIEGRLKKEKIAYYKITGATSKEARLEYVKLFNEDETPVFLISLKAGGTGLNLTGADIVIHFDPWWNVAAQNQATDRAHRIGQEKVVSVYKLIAKGTIEEKIVKLQEIKKDLADEILNGESGNIMSMSKDELLELISASES